MHTQNNNIKIWYEVHGQGEPTIVMVPGFQIIHSAAFKRSYVPFLSRHMRVVTFDLRGSGQSDKPEQGHDLDTYAADLHAVITAAGLNRFAILGLSLGAKIAVTYCAQHPRNVTHLILLSGSAKMIRSETYPAGMPAELLTGLQHMWKTAPEDMLKGFIEIASSEKHALRAKELTWKWAHETSPKMWQLGFAAATLTDIDAELEKIGAPTLIVHGLEDKSTLPSAAEYLHHKIPRSRLILMPESGHGFFNTWPQVARQTLDFLKPPPERPRSRRSASAPRILWVSSPIGLGHVKRDLAIAAELRKRAPQTRIEWLASGPARSALEIMQEPIHPLSDALWDENQRFEGASTDYALNPTEVYWEMDDLLANNFMVFSDAATQGAYDLVVADEAWEVHRYLHYNPSLNKTPFVFMTDFIGALTVSDHKKEIARVKDLNGSWLEMRALHPETIALPLFIGEAEDLPDIPLGEGLPNIRQWAMQHFRFPGYVLPADIADYSDRQALRKEMGFSPAEKVLLVAVGGTSAGKPLIEKCLRAQPELNQKVPDLRTVVLSGARIDPGAFGAVGNVRVLPFVKDPLKLYAACDIAIIQGGLSTAMELTALGRPFFYFPLKNHFEQQHFVDFRLKRYNAGIRMDFDTTSTADIARMVAAHIDKPVAFKPVNRDGAAKIADMILNINPNTHP
jgi:pimeloyl-ACP methyl ester carboxylesterase/UDP:flavonoid glycosyltransferase YjiC (YdhE family)